MKIIPLLFLALSVTIFAQYTQNDRKLAATTFTRNFDKVISKDYLTSDNDEKIIAGLLSVSHSEDTAFVPTITSLPLEKFGREICFALAQLGPCSSSIDYLKKIVYKTDNDPLINYYVIVALGEIADSTFAKKLISDYDAADNKSKFNGISLALYYFFSRGNISAKDARPVLENELYYSSSRQFEAAFSLYRIGPVSEESKLIVNTLKKILDGKLISPVTEKPVPYLLACLRKLQYFPDDFDLFVQLKSLKDFQSRIEAVRASVFYKFKNQKQIDNYLEYLSDENGNISREAATSLINFNSGSQLKDYLYLKISELLHTNTDLEKYTKGELFLSTLSLFPKDFNDVFLQTIDDKISNEYLYKACALYSGSEEALKILSEKYLSEKLPEQIIILESILNFDESKNETVSVLFSALNSAEPGLIAVAADGLDSSFISSNKDSIIKIINYQVENNQDKPDYIESLLSLENLAGKISGNFQNQIISLLSGSKLYSIRKFTADKNGRTIRSISKEIDNFNDFWEIAFEYKEAEIVTQKGSFIISFLPGYAPISVGNFCSLVNKRFYEGIPFHRVVPGFVIQGGDPTGTGWGGPGYEIISEFSPLEFNKGIVGMASAGKDTEGSQWFVTTGDYPHLNGRYTIFAEVLSGLDVVEKITQDDKILSINLIR